MPDDQEFQSRIRRIEELIQILEDTAVPTTRAQARELVQAILEHHGVGLAKIMELANQFGNPRLLESLVHDDLVGSLLLLHGLHPVDPVTRAQQAYLNSIHDYLIALARLEYAMGVTPTPGSSPDHRQVGCP